MAVVPESKVLCVLGQRCPPAVTVARALISRAVNRGKAPDQRIHVTPNTPASQGVTACQPKRARVPGCADYRRTLERDPKAAVNFESASRFKPAPAGRIASFRMSR